MRIAEVDELVRDSQLSVPIVGMQALLGTVYASTAIRRDDAGAWIF